MTTTTMRSIMTIIAVVALVLTSGTAAIAVPTKQLPFKESLSGGVTSIVFAENFPDGDAFDGRCIEPSQMLTTMAGTGEVSHLGRVTWTSTHCTQLFAGTFGEADLVITAANNDTLSGTYSGWLTGPTTFVETMTILGGTGRFAGATGTVEEAGAFDPVTFDLEIGGEGWISYDASESATH